MLKDRLATAVSGDYVVTEQAGGYSLLHVRFRSERHLILEEVDIPLINCQTCSWKEWLQRGASGHTAWNSYFIDLQEEALIEVYSYSQEAWLYAKDPNHFLPKLLHLSLEKTQEGKRKKIGPPPMEGEIDRRAFWLPPRMTQDEASKQKSVTVWEGRWPKDLSVISNAEVVFYFSQSVFPDWMEIKTPHYAVHIKSVEIGNGIRSPKPLVFQQIPCFLETHWESGKAAELKLYSPKYHYPLQLMAVDLVNGDRHPIQLIEKTDDNSNEQAVRISEEVLKSSLSRGRVYRFALSSVEFPDTVIYSDSVFHH